MSKAISPAAFSPVRATIIGAVLLVGATGGPACAALTVSSQPTQNVDCSGGVCSATAPDAVLNVADLANLLAAAPLTIVSGEAQDISFSAPFSWTSANALTLDAYRSLEIQKRLSDMGPAAISLVINDGGAKGDLSFGRAGRISFASTSNKLKINGKSYKLVGSIAELSAGIAIQPRGSYALANNYDASANGSYSRTPIQTEFAGTFEGLGNAISNFAMYDTADEYISLFSVLKHSGVLRDVRLLNVNILGENTFFNFIGPLVGYNGGTVLQCSATGAIRSDFALDGGGLISLSYGHVEKSFADVFVSGAEDAEVGGLIGNAHGTVSDAYATGQVIAGDRSAVGGLIGYFIGKQVSRTYSTGAVSGGQAANVGGLIGESAPQVAHSYWDVTTSGTTNGTAGGNMKGIKGLTTEELQSGLPKGFGAGVWTQSKKINNGFPYLIANPPVK